MRRSVVQLLSITSIEVSENRFKICVKKNLAATTLKVSAAKRWWRIEWRRNDGGEMNGGETIAANKSAAKLTAANWSRRNDGGELVAAKRWRRTGRGETMAANWSRRIVRRRNDRGEMTDFV
ncbi:unnamed protein product [Macrosiphum euphorbiae]|uniref:Uncharacterized protein n=1 Tax=Macrosiphum euphorbiae TaxID=13131 RepID=A0AAV0XM14_9HEMI|nr:unnamed protein product [Macrosiphum euphorbiae]